VGLANISEERDFFPIAGATTDPTLRLADVTVDCWYILICTIDPVSSHAGSL